jgi:hypothetical protein
MTSCFHRVVFAASVFALTSCNAEPVPKAANAVSSSPPPEAPAPSTPPTPPHEGEVGKSETDDSELLALLPSTKIDLARGIAQAERQGARAISAKFELDDGKLLLSVYTAAKGIDADAEHNVLAELSGDPTRADWQPKEEIFADGKHLTRASYHLTLVQRSRTTLGAVMAKALAKQPGQVYSIEPGIHDRAPVFHVLVAAPGGGRVKVDVQSEG